VRVQEDAGKNRQKLNGKKQRAWDEARQKADENVQLKIKHFQREATKAREALQRKQEQENKSEALAVAQGEVDERRRRKREGIQMLKLTQQRIKRQTRRASLNTGTMNWYDAKRDWLKLIFAVRGLSTPPSMKWGGVQARRGSCHGMDVFTATVVPKIKQFLADKNTDREGKFRTVDVQFSFAEQRFEISDGLVSNLEAACYWSRKPHYYWSRKPHYCLSRKPYYYSHTVLVKASHSHLFLLSFKSMQTAVATWTWGSFSTPSHRQSTTRCLQMSPISWNH
jgi:hypothetical protein